MASVVYMWQMNLILTNGLRFLSCKIKTNYVCGLGTGIGLHDSKIYSNFYRSVVLMSSSII